LYAGGADTPAGLRLMAGETRALVPRFRKKAFCEVWVGPPGWEAMARRSIALYSNIGWNWLGLAGALALQGKHGEAAEAQTSVRALMPSYTPSRFHCGARLVYGRRRFRDDVEADYRQLRDALKESLRL
jgi:hypothetical protein